MLSKIILASKSEVRKEILNKNNIKSLVMPSNVDEDIVKKSLLKEEASPEIISKNLAELKANKISQKKKGDLVLGADSVIDIDGELISKPQNRFSMPFEIMFYVNCHHVTQSALIAPKSRNYRFV